MMSTIKSLMIITNKFKVVFILNIRKYEDFIKHRLLEIEAWTRNGITEKEIAKKLGISYSTFREYKKKHTALAKALANNKVVTDIKVENALYKRAIGYKYDEVTKELVTAKDKYGDPVIDMNGAMMKELKVTKIVTKEVQPDVGAQQFWLKNRNSKDWREKQEIESTNINLNEDLTILNKEQRNARIEELKKKLMR